MPSMYVEEIRGVIRFNISSSHWLTS